MHPHPKGTGSNPIHGSCVCIQRVIAAPLLMLPFTSTFVSFLYVLLLILLQHLLCVPEPPDHCSPDKP